MDSYSELRRKGEHSKFSAHNHISVTNEDGQVRGELRITEESLNMLGVVHGGCLCALADSVAGTLVAADGRAGVTLSCNMNYLRPAVGEVGKTITCTGRLQKSGRTIAVCDTYLTNEAGALVATGTFTFYRKE